MALSKDGAGAATVGSIAAQAAMVAQQGAEQGEGQSGQPIGVALEPISIMPAWAGSTHAAMKASRMPVENQRL